MCMLIYHPAGARAFTREEFVDFNRKNPHGFGAMWRTRSGRISGKKGLVDVDTQWKLYCDLRKRGIKTMALHWRFATAGTVGVDNCHPIYVRDEVYMMHNGANIGPARDGKSDSVCFAEDVLAPKLPRSARGIRAKRHVAELTSTIGHGNRLIIWHADDDRPVIIGEHRGLWHRGRWYSNEYAWDVNRFGPEPKPAKVYGKKMRYYSKLEWTPVTKDDWYLPGWDDVANTWFNDE